MENNNNKKISTAEKIFKKKKFIVPCRLQTTCGASFRPQIHHTRRLRVPASVEQDEAQSAERTCLLERGISADAVAACLKPYSAYKSTFDKIRAAVRPENNDFNDFDVPDKNKLTRQFSRSRSSDTTTRATSHAYSTSCQATLFAY